MDVAVILVDHLTEFQEVKEPCNFWRLAFIKVKVKGKVVPVL
jgi:hypothetical protein